MKFFGALLLLVLIIFIGPWITQLLWGWVVPDVFGGAVEHGILFAKITWWQAFKLDLLVLALVGSSRK